MGRKVILPFIDKDDNKEYTVNDVYEGKREDFLTEKGYLEKDKAEKKSATKKKK